MSDLLSSIAAGGSPTIHLHREMKSVRGMRASAFDRAAFGVSGIGISYPAPTTSAARARFHTFKPMVNKILSYFMVRKCFVFSEFKPLITDRSHTTHKLSCVPA
jgi:hypothetical protein